MAFKSLYTAKATVTGGRDGGHGETDDAEVAVDFALPESMGGPGGPGTNPEQLFALGYAACFEGSIQAVAGEADTSGLTIHSAVEIGKTADGLGLQVTLDVSLPNVDDDDAGQLVGKAHKVCAYSKATRGNIDVTLIANARTLVG